jgi:hypothetical protein
MSLAAKYVNSLNSLGVRVANFRPSSDMQQMASALDLCNYYCFEILDSRFRLMFSTICLFYSHMIMMKFISDRLSLIFHPK